ncbi:DUF362 domain-containing protein [Candidatus Poribacteria bacterium]|nr:DUF362 domain-containing protein [Candidatus Poribacteria bacterium]
MSKVLILDCNDYNFVDGSIKKVFQEFPLDFSNKKVLVKPNMLNDYRPERATVTHPAVIKAVVQYLLDAGAEVWVGDNPGVFGSRSNEKCAQSTGIAEASMGCYRNISKEGIPVKLKSRFVDELLVSREVMDADIMISLPKFKTHTLTQITGAIKNSFGTLVGGEKTKMHAITSSYKGFSEALVDIYQIRVPDLVIMDGILGMEGNGPSSGDIRHIGKIIASDDGVAVDAAMTTMMGKKPQKIYCLKVAEKRDIGDIDVSNMEIVGELNAIQDFEMPATFLCHMGGWAVNNRIFRFFMERRPFMLEGKCEGCGRCAKVCPARAIKIVNKFPVIDRKACIECYCCQELCPSDAVELRRRI